MASSCFCSRSTCALSFSRDSASAGSLAPLSDRPDASLLCSVLKGENIFMACSNSAMFCLPISSRLPNGNMPPKVSCHGLAHALLVGGEGLHHVVQVARHHPLHGVAVEADQLAQEVDRQQVLPLGLLLDDDLGQHRAGDVLAGLGVVDHEVDPVLDHLAQVVEGDVAAGRRVVEPPVGVLLDRDRAVFVSGFLGRHVSHLSPGRGGTGASGLDGFMYVAVRRTILLRCGKGCQCVPRPGRRLRPACGRGPDAGGRAGCAGLGRRASV